MGNFSRDPKTRMDDSVSKHYVGVKLQQGVPVLDADWNELEDLRRNEFETLGVWFIGSGVPSGSDGFHIVSVSQPNDFEITKGLCLVNGKIVKNDAVVRYTTQPNFGNLTQAQLVPPLTVPAPVPALTMPAADKQLIVYLDLWEREVDSEEDPALVDVRIGVETAVRWKREWAVRVVDASDLNTLQSPPPGHDFYPLARLNRKQNNNTITTDMIEDLRDTQVSVRRKIEVRDSTGKVVVDNNRFRLVLESTRNNVLAFIRYITTQFNPIFASLTSAEVLGLQAGEYIAGTAEIGLGLLNSDSLANTGALRFLFQLYQAENAFMTVWHDFVLKLAGVVPTINLVEARSLPGATPKKYASYQNFIAQLADRLNPSIFGATVDDSLAFSSDSQAVNLGEATIAQQEFASPTQSSDLLSQRIIVGDIPIDAPIVTSPGLLTVLQAGNLEGATAIQEEIAALFLAAGANVARGSIQVFLGLSPAGNLTNGQVARFEFRVRSFTTMADTYTVTVEPAGGWPRRVVDAQGNPTLNNRVPIDSSGTESTIFIDVDVQAGSSGLRLRVISNSNPEEINQLSGLFTLTEGQPAPVGEDPVQLHLTNMISNATLNRTTDVVSIQKTVQGVIEVELLNKTGRSATFSMDKLLQNPIGAWTVEFVVARLPIAVDSASTVGSEASRPVAPGGPPQPTIAIDGRFPALLSVKPGSDAVSAQLRITAATIDGPIVTGEVVIPLTALPAPVSPGPPVGGGGTATA